MRQFKRRSPRNARGVLLVWVAIVGTLFVQFVMLATDVSYVYLTAHQLQNAADAAALAGAARVKFNQAQATTDAVNTALANKAAGATVQLDAAGGDVVLGNYNRTTATFTPNTAPFNACQTLARRTASSPGGALNLIFAPAFGINTSDIFRGATAMSGGTLGAGMVVLDLTRKSSLGTVGNSDLQINNGAIQVNSSDANAVTVKGTSSVEATELRIVGGSNTNGGATLPPKTYTDATPVEDPLKNLPIPAKGTDLGAINITGNNVTENHGPGYYSGGIRMTGKGSVLNLSPGIYVLGPPGLDMEGGTLNATGCMFFITTGNAPGNYGTIKLTGGATINISPPTSGPWAGVSIFQDPTTPYNKSSASIEGNETMNLQGTLYLPSINLDMSGTSNNFANQIIVDTVNVAGTGTLRVNYDGRNPVEINNVFLVR